MKVGDRVLVDWPPFRGPLMGILTEFWEDIGWWKVDVVPRGTNKTFTCWRAPGQIKVVR